MDLENGRIRIRWPRFRIAKDSANPDPPWMSRLISVIRVLALVLLAALLFCRRKEKKKDKEPEDSAPSAAGAAAALLTIGAILFATPQQAAAQFPNAELLAQLQQRLTETPPEFPGAVEIANASMKIEGESVVLELEYHAAARAAAPVPLPLGSMEPKSASFSTGDKATVLRKENRLWVLLPDAGIHTILVEGALRAGNDWEWGFALKPRHIQVEAPGWTVSGIRPDQSAEDQVLFPGCAKKEKRPPPQITKIPAPTTPSLWSGRSSLVSSGAFAQRYPASPRKAGPRRYRFLC